MKSKTCLIMALIAAALCNGCSTADQENIQDVSTKENLLEETGDTKEQEIQKKDNSKYSPIEVNDVTIPDVEYPYEIQVNRAMNCVTVYTLDKDEQYTVPVRAMICSTGGDKTLEGSFQTGTTSEWLMLYDGSYGQYATRIVDDILIHSVPYLTQNKDALNVEEYNKLGETASSGCIRLETADAKWISENCIAGTKVLIYDDEASAGPLGKPEARLIEGTITWDPTDEDTDNGWYVPVSFSGITNKTIHIGESVSLSEGVTAKDKYGNDLTSGIQVFGNVNVNVAGTYEITYSCSNTEGEAREVRIQINVVQEQESTAATEREQTANTPKLWVNEPIIYVNDSVQDVKGYLLSFAQYKGFASGFSSNSIQIVMDTLQEEMETHVDYYATDTDGQIYHAMTKVIYDRVPPQLTIIADTRFTPNVSTDTLGARVKSYDAIGLADGVYITVQPLSTKNAYVIIYEVFDLAGNSTCISETVFISDYE